MRRLLALSVLAAAASVGFASPAQASCPVYAGSEGTADARVCVRSTCGDLCWTYIEPSCTGLPVDCAAFAIVIGPY